MKIKSFISISMIMLMTLFIMKGSSPEKKKEMNILLLPSLPNPIAKEYVLITSAGQSTDAYIINDIANKLMIHSYFMPQAMEGDLEGANTLVIVAGYSPLGEKLHDTSFYEEKKRISGLLEKSKQENLTVIAVYIGGMQQRGKKTDELLSLICSEADYLIATKDSNGDSFLSDLVKSKRIPLTLVNGVNDISEPFVSAFH